MRESERSMACAARAASGSASRTITARMVERSIGSRSLFQSRASLSLMWLS